MRTIFTKSKRNLSLVLSFILFFSIMNFKTIISKETVNLELPNVHKQTLNTSLEGNDYLYPVKIDGLYGFINVNGKLIVEPQFTSVQRLPFDIFEAARSGYYLAQIHDEEYVYSGTYLILPKTKVIKISDDDGFARLSNNKRYAFINNEYILDLNSRKTIDKSIGDYYIMGVYDNRYVVKDKGLYYLKDYDKKTLTRGYEYFEGFNDGNYFFLDYGDPEEERLFTLYWLDQNGKILFNYNGGNYAMPFLNDIAPVFDYNLDLKFIDKNKNVVNMYKSSENGFEHDSSKFQTLSINRLEDFYIVNYGNNILLLNSKGQKMISGDDLIYTSYENSVAAFNTKTSILTTFNKDGTIKGSYKLPDGYTTFNERYFGGAKTYTEHIILNNGKKFGLGKIIDGKFNWILKPEYDHIGGDPYFVVYQNNLAGLFDPSSEKIIVEPKYKYISTFDKNMIHVETEEYEGYINPDGQLIHVQEVEGITYYLF